MSGSTPAWWRTASTGAPGLLKGHRPARRRLTTEGADDRRGTHCLEDFVAAPEADEGPQPTEGGELAAIEDAHVGGHEALAGGRVIDDQLHRGLQPFLLTVAEVEAGGEAVDYVADDLGLGRYRPLAQRTVHERRRGSGDAVGGDQLLG